MTQLEQKIYVQQRVHSRWFDRVGMLGVIMSTLFFSGMMQANETQRMESLGVVNGNMAARNMQVDITAFLSGQPLFKVADLAETDALTTLTIEQARVVSRDGNTFRIQQVLTLPDGTQGTVLLPLQVRIEGKPVTSTLTENSLGVKVELPAPARTVDIVPTGAVQLTIPAGYRGDLTTQWRISGESSLPKE